MTCHYCKVRPATRYGNAGGNVTTVGCETCTAGRGWPLRAPWLRPLTVMWWAWLNLRGGRAARRARLAKAAEYFAKR